MKNVRIFYAKGGRMRFISHLDMTRFMARMVRKAGLPVWYTEGFHSHLYLTFALPLSLGYISEYDVMDLRLLDDEMSCEAVRAALESVLPAEIKVLHVAEPVLKTGKVAFARFEIRFEDGGALQEPLERFLAKEKIPVAKKTKRGDEKEIDLKEKIRESAVETVGGNTVLHLLLPAGPNDNINPELLTAAFFDSADAYYPSLTVRTDILDETGERFR